jgi:hypothetical protein
MIQQPIIEIREGARLVSPFGQELVLGYYDGSIEGLLRTKSGDASYYYRMLAWEQETQRLRIFALAPLDASGWDRVVAAHAQFEPPRWPAWAPRWRPELDKQGIEVATRQVLAQAGPIQWIVAGWNLLDELRAVRATSPAQLAGVRDWADFLGLEERPTFVATDFLFEQE